MQMTYTNHSFTTLYYKVRKEKCDKALQTALCLGHSKREMSGSCSAIHLSNLNGTTYQEKKQHILGIGTIQVRVNF